ncbi:MAG: hypothetical protein IJU40_09060, partial [Desulfovibrionaceae bacterium]|nr:hypothetical protein [Desulfovibrionaceae bacterium]
AAAAKKIFDSMKLRVPHLRGVGFNGKLKIDEDVDEKIERQRLISLEEFKALRGGVEARVPFAS